MVLYNEKGNKVRYNTKDHIGKLSCGGNIFTIDEDTCIKKFKNKESINLATIKEIMALNLTNFYEIKELLFDQKGAFSGYTMKYYPSNIYDILKMPSTYTLENFNNILKSIDRLTEEGVLVSDLHQDNVILTNDGIIVIDVDLYSKSSYSTPEQIKKNNHKALLYLFKKLYLEALETYFISYDEKEMLQFIITNLFKEENINTTCKELSDYEYPIDYIKSKVRRRLR